MTVSDWFSTTQNWAFLAMAVPTLFAAFRVVTTRNVVHSVLYLVVALGGSAAMFILLGAEFVAWTVVLVNIGAIVVLFLFGTMITRAPAGKDPELSAPRFTKLAAAAVSGLLFIVIGGAMLDGFQGQTIDSAAGPTGTAQLGEALFTRYVIPFEVVSFLLLGALIGGIVLARPDPEPGEGSGL